MTALPALGSTYVNTRNALHRIAVYVMWSARFPVDGRFRLTPTPGGFGFQNVGPDVLGVRVDGTDLVVERSGEVSRTPMTTLVATLTAAGVELNRERSTEFDVPPVGDPAAPLAIDPEAARALANWFEFSRDVLGALIADAPDSASEVVLWPEHFDCAFDHGSELDGTRGTYGASPGDVNTPEPYLYVLPWGGTLGDGFWNADGFDGAWLHYRDLGTAPRERALAFFRDARLHLTGRA